MSALIVSDKTISAVLDALRESNKNEPDSVWPDMRFVDPPIPLLTFQPDDKFKPLILGAEIFGLNVKAIIALYGYTRVAKEQITSRGAFTYQKVRGLTPVQAYAALSHLLYQLGWKDIPADPLYIQLESYRNILADNIVRMLPDFPHPWD